MSIPARRAALGVVAPALLVFLLAAVPTQVRGAEGSAAGSGESAAALRARVSELEEKLATTETALARARPRIPIYWEIFSWIAAVAFGSRFIVQWIASERAKRSVIPRSFWYLSIVGSLGLLSYSLYVFALVGANLAVAAQQAVGLVPYTRNLALSRRARIADEESREENGKQ